MDFNTLLDPHTIAVVLVGIAVFATVIVVASPLMATDKLDKRMKWAASEREKIRAREREKIAGLGKATLRQTPKAYMKQIVDRFNLNSWLGTEEAKSQMAMAGFRGVQAETAFLFFRLVVPIAFLVLGTVYMLFLSNFDWPPIMKFGFVVFCAYLGLKAPELFVRNTIKKRQQSISRAFPDAMDLLLICVESGMSVEHAFRKVSQEIGATSVPLAEELTLTTAELSFLPDRRKAYENLAKRTGVDSVNQVATVLVQAERYGTPLGQALRVLAQESRDHRLLLAEQKAASLPPKLTVPMILFFLPILFAVILTPAIIQISGMK
jgi:tight adherence protein C